MSSSGLAHRPTVELYERVYTEGGDRKVPDSNIVRLIEWVFCRKGMAQGYVLEWGFGGGANLIYLLQRGFSVIGFEAATAAVKLTEGKLQSYPEFDGKWELRVVHPQDERLPLSDNTCDFVLANESLYLCSSELQLQAVLRELHRVLKRGGIIVASMMGPRHSWVTKGRWIDENLVEYQGSSGDPAVSIVVTKDAAQARELFKEFSVEEVGFFDFEFCGRAHHHFVVIASK
jgi:SAM-dependent methyltransferase